MSEDPGSSGTLLRVLKVLVGVLIAVVCIGLLVFGICAYALTKS